ncbi:phage fiber-tail adaptor protein [Oceanicella actignis]|uniref:Uncharacterized protein n=1 Tax=Oceanicella actignis TaxID=1189325 RepID=A0A1M7TZH4_9RHOB|nr:hypothetical protein [Oceanicella actignis]TYO85051.1 hypothetical protein LY05_02765 [Oceanicella actignis]SET83419.1 hypothetical protein SAMN04488119_11123 [Oceanicella actignis]SHN76192.1 hypothetical protein SAMN05216200_11222 [Oceanicella actignis]
MSSFVTKTAAEMRRFVVDWPLEPGETLEGAPGWFVIPQELDTQGVRVAAVRDLGARSEVTLAGGLAGRLYHVACRARTSAARVLTRGFLLRVEA